MAIRAKAAFSLKDALFNRDTVGELAAAFEASLPSFERNRFEGEVLAAFPELELKARINHIVTVLGGYLPGRWAQSLAVLRRAMPPPLDPSRSDDDFGHFIWAVPGEYVARHGCTARRLTSALEFLRFATMRFSSEAAIRPFLNAFPEDTLAFVHACARDDNYHVRRLASEGIRPYLPWAERVMLPPARVIEVLDRLHVDRTRYVTRSVANTLNDISRTDAELVIATLERWRAHGRQKPDELAWITRHALRTLIKDGDAGALALLGYPAAPAIRISTQRGSPRVNVGDAYRFRCMLTSEAEQRLLVKLRVYFRKASGGLTPKVFALADLACAAGEAVALDKKVSFRPVTTRTLYPGRHRAELMVNGVVAAEHTFSLVVPT